jgi:methionine-rich copper-binding protein CopC
MEIRMKTMLTLAFELALVSTTSAFAHAHLLSAAPAAKAVLTTAPTELTLKFSESLEPKFTSAEVTGPDNVPVAHGAAALDPKDSTLLKVPLTRPLAAGSYTVAWHVLSRDGHKTSGTYSFTVK